MLSFIRCMCLNNEELTLQESVLSSASRTYIHVVDFRVMFN